MYFCFLLELLVRVGESLYEGVFFFLLVCFYYGYNFFYNLYYFCSRKLIKKMCMYLMIKIYLKNIVCRRGYSGVGGF